ncbi:MAG: primary-amine oxidase [Proteobacteria bacterium]|nr:primary-amine oxidase [Pseudomonadota bacterium]
MTSHPLDPLNAVEIAAAAELVRSKGGLSPEAWFETIALHEPSKAELGAGKSRRQAFVCCYDPASGETWFGIADLANNALIDWHHAAGMQARIVTDEFVLCGEMAKQDPRFVEACARRGITDMDAVSIEPWAAGNFGVKAEEGERIAYGHCFHRNANGDNPYARPIANLHPVIDLRRRRVIRIDDFGVVPLPPECTPITTAKPREDVKALEITQPGGASFAVEGHLVKWQKWRIRVGFHVRDGLILHEIGYEDGGRVRPIMHRASLSEMVVPYGEPGGGNYRRNAFDTGEYGIGQLTDSLTLGCDCLGHIHYFDAWRHDWNGKPVLIKNAVCMHEEDFGILWKYSNWLTRDVTVKRSRRFVISSICTIGNYVYGFFWYFYQDGTIGVEVKATGIPLPTAIPVGSEPKHGAAVASGINAHVHQHVFSFRFDMTVDGERNALREVSFAGRPYGPDNPHGNAIDVSERKLASESEAQGRIDLATQAYWKVVNTAKPNSLGQPVGYKLVPGVNALPFLPPDSPVGKRAGFMYNHFWATQFAPEELYAAGLFPNQHKGGDGLPAYAAKNRNLEGENLVVWYTLNYHHLPRPEDWPVQPCVYANFHWMPVGFFDENPGLDVPAAKPAHCCT